MTSYVESIGEDIASVNRTFNAANQLVLAVDSQALISSFYYDNNGNLERTILPGISEETILYSYDQRNLLTQVSRRFGQGQPAVEAAFVYDGRNNRLQQIAYGSGTPITTTYTNDIIGLAQVLAAGNGLTTTHMLFGLDLIAQDDGSQTRILLADGLGSTRLEMVGSQVETTTTYEPYGKLLAQTGPSGTVYGYTGEAHDASTGLIFLRARYYSPYLNQFLSRDPFPGYATLPASLNGFNYVHANPINFVDPSGLCIPEQNAAPYGECTPSLPDYPKDSTSLFNFTVLPGSPGGDISAYIQVSYRQQPWRKYASISAPYSPVMIPVRHPLNLFEENPYCGDSLEAAKEHYTNGSFTMWEVNARNLIAEIGGVIAAQEEWALRDAIGIAYVPYNRVEYNKENPDDPFHPYKGRNDPLGMLLSGDGQFAVAATASYEGALNPGTERENVYHFALVVAYGVDKKYFDDTSYGATNYNHRPYDPEHPEQKHCEVLDKYYTYTFFKDKRNVNWNWYDRALTSAELEAQDGWPDWARNDDKNLHYGDWITGYPPYGCN